MFEQLLPRAPKKRGRKKKGTADVYEFEDVDTPFAMNEVADMDFTTVKTTQSEPAFMFYG
jgi:hypothetical protein